MFKLEPEDHVQITFFLSILIALSTLGIKLLIYFNLSPSLVIIPYFILGILVIKNHIAFSRALKRRKENTNALHNNEIRDRD